MPSGESLLSAGRQPFRRTNGMSTGPRSGRKVRIPVSVAGVRSAEPRGDLYTWCCRLPDMQIYFESQQTQNGGLIWIFVSRETYVMISLCINYYLYHHFRYKYNFNLSTILNIIKITCMPQPNFFQKFLTIQYPRLGMRSIPCLGF